MNRGIAIVTGASSGIGERFAIELCSKERRIRYPNLPDFDEIVLVARRADRLETLARRLEGVKVTILVLDLVAPDSAVKIAGYVKASGKPVTFLVNNAGYGIYGNFSTADLDLQVGEIDLNCRALTQVCGILSPSLTRGSTVINVSSLAAFAPLGGFAVYAATKAYVLSFSVALAAEWKERGIRVVTLCPGSVQSEFSLVASGGRRKEVKHGWPADRLVKDCLKAANGGRWISMPRFVWKLRRFAGWLGGPVASARFTKRFMKRPAHASAPGSST